MTEIARFAPAKVNLTLEVTGRRANGYHDLQSLVVFAEDLGDRLIFAADDELSLDITGTFAGQLDGGGDNLVLAAARLLRESFGVTRGARITLEKELPVAAGIGGGSADAAAALRGLAELWQLSVDDGRLAELGLSLGADLPVCLSGAGAWVTGIGEGLDFLEDLPPFHALLVNPMEPLSTPQVFKRFAEASNGKFTSVRSAPARGLSAQGLLDWLESAGNDLEGPARSLCPKVGEVLDELAALPGCRLARMSGSGATSFALFADREEAGQAFRRLSAARPGWWVGETRLAALKQA